MKQMNTDLLNLDTSEKLTKPIFLYLSNPFLGHHGEIKLLKREKGKHDTSSSNNLFRFNNYILNKQLKLCGESVI